MEPENSQARQQQDDDEDTQPRRAINVHAKINTLAEEPSRAMSHRSALVSTHKQQSADEQQHNEQNRAGENEFNVMPEEESERDALEYLDTQELSVTAQEQERDEHIDAHETVELPTLQERAPLEEIATHRLPQLANGGSTGSEPPSRGGASISRGRALTIAALLLIILISATHASFTQFIGPQGWAYVLGGPAGSNQNLLQNISSQLKNHTPGATAQATASRLTPQQYINLIIQNMTLDQKLGQMMFVQFTGPSYSLDLSTMLSQYDVGAVILFTANNNIISQEQLRSLTSQIQKDAPAGIPLLIATDQEGGQVDRLRALDGPRPSAASIGASNDPARARAAGVQDAQDLASYGINLNLAPVVDVTNVYNPQLYQRTYGNNPQLVTSMAEAYLEGLQQSRQVLGTLKHFPGLGDVGVDPHNGVPYLTRTKSQLEAIDWAPYRALIRQGHVHAVMVTHEIVTALDSSEPSSLSHKVVTDILRNDLGFQGVIMTDSLTMEGITARYTEGQAAVLAVQAGADLLMGAVSAQTTGDMLHALKQAVSTGQISQQRIDDSVRRILTLKYELGLIKIPQG